MKAAPAEGQDLTRQVRRVALAVFVLFAALFVNLNYLQVLRADELREDNRNARGLIAEYEIRRGSIVAGDGDAALEVAEVEETDGRLRYRRLYPRSRDYAHVTGHYSFVYGRTQLEAAFNDYLTGSAPETFTRNIGDLLTGREREGDDLITTLRPPVQEAASEALGGRRGAVVALAPGSGEILAMVSHPSYDPERLASHDGEEVRAYWEELEADPERPALNRATSEWYPPGSVFKLVTAAAALENGYDPGSTFDDPVRRELPLTTASIGNFGGGVCADGESITLERAVEVSCNTTFAQLGLELGADTLVDQAERFGLNQDWDFQLPLQTSRFDREALDEPATAQSAIGQRDVRVTPLQMAMITGTIANDGVVVRPRVVRRVEDYAGRIIQQFRSDPLVFPGAEDAQAIGIETAGALQDMMVGVVEDGTGTRAAIDGVTVAGKTGTAQTGDGPPTVWFVGYAPTDEPQVAVAVVVEDGGDVGDDATGGAVAAPIARDVITAALTGRDA